MGRTGGREKGERGGAIFLGIKCNLRSRVTAGKHTLAQITGGPREEEEEEEEKALSLALSGEGKRGQNVRRGSRKPWRTRAR